MNKFFCIFFIILFISITENVFSNNIIYNVNNVEINGKNNNNTEKKKITELAFKKAFIIFINKTLLKEDAKSLSKITAKTVNNLVLNYQLIETKIGDDNKTISTFNINFDPKKINNFFAERTISYADITNISLTLLPILIVEKDIFLYEENFFYKNWNKMKEGSKIRNDDLISYNLALENIEDLEYINNIKGNLDLIDINKINSFNKNENSALLIIYSTKNNFKAFIKTSIKNKRIDKYINLSLPKADKDKSYEETIVILKKEIIQIWKKQNLIDVNTPSFLDFFLEKKQSDDYLKLKSILDTLDVVESYSVLEMTNMYTKVRLKYRGKLNKIKDKLIEQKINIQIIDNIWKLKIKQ